MKIAILGDGLLGQELYEYMKQIDKFDVHQFTRKEIGDILDVTSWYQDGFYNWSQYDCIINCIAYTNVVNAEINTDACFELNVRFPSNFGYYLSQYGFNGRIIHFSTDYVYGDACSEDRLCYEEDVNPVNYYGLTKYLGEQGIYNSYQKTLVFRISSLYGNYRENFVSKILDSVVDLKMVNDIFMSSTYALDIAEMLSRHIIWGTMPYYGIYNYSDIGRISWYDFTKEIIELSGKNIKIKSVKYKGDVRRPKNSATSKDKFIKDFKDFPSVWQWNLQRYIHETVNSNTNI